MMTPYSTNTMLDVLAGKTAEAPSTNEDIAAHEQEIHPVSHDPIALRLLPGFIRRPLKSWIEARRYERTLIQVWENSPHLLNDMGIVLTDKSALPDHLVAAPARVIEHISIVAPEQIVEAELAYPANPAAVAEAGSGDAESKAKAAAALPMSSAI